MRKQLLITMVVVLVVSSTMFLLMAFVLSSAPYLSSSTQALAADVITPTITALEPSSAYNDLDTAIIITGTDFIAEMSSTLVLTSPTAYLGSTALMDVTWVNSTSITASVPWGLDPGGYTLTIVNPDGGTGSLGNAYTVTQGIGQWNGGDLFGGEVRYIQLKPGDPSTIYAVAYQVGLFRSRDGGENWNFICDKLLGNIKVVIDPSHPSWLYYVYDGLYRSQDEGDTWIKILNTWPDGRNLIVGQVYPSPTNDQVLFLSSSADPGVPPTDALGLIKSTDGGLSWNIMADMEGISVQDVDFHPTDPLQMVLATEDGKVFQSTDEGDTWSEVNKPPLSNISSITYNPYKPIEVWVTLTGASGIYKSTDADFSWIDVTPADSQNYIMWFVKFTSADSVYTIQHQSADGGLTWQQFGPLTGYGEMSFNPDNSQVGYIGDHSFGVQKTLDGGQTWEIKNQGLTGLTPYQIETSQVDPLQVYALFGDSPGAYRSDDGANSWTFLPLDGFDHVCAVRIDPFNPQYIYLATNSGFCTSTNEGLSWTNLGWNWNIPGPWAGGPAAMQPDPYQPGHLLVGFNFTSDNTSRLLSSIDYGVSWQLITVTEESDLAIAGIVFHPDTPGLVYLISAGTGVYRSFDSGNTWERIDDLQQPDMALAQLIAIATHPQPMLLVGNAVQYPFRSLDGGVTWDHPQSPLGGVRAYMFLDGDSTRLYAATWSGLFYSNDAGDSWERAAGTIGELNVSALGYAVDVEDNYTILYAATIGGDQSGTLSKVVDPTLQYYTPESNLVEAGIYRYVQHIRQIFLPMTLR